MKVLVTGGSGALGSEVCEQLNAGGHEAVTFDLAAPKAGGEWFRGDIRDGVALLEAVRMHDVAAIVHLASLLSLEARPDPRRAVEINSLGMVNALDAARILGVRRFVWASTGGVFAGGAGPETVANDAPYRPQDVYGGTKILNETLADHYHHAYGLETIGLRFPAITGAGQPTSLIGMLRAALVEKPVAGEPSVVRFADDVPNWLWIGDAARAVTIATLASSAPAGNYNLGGDIRPLRDAIAIIEQLVPGASITAEPGTTGLELRLDPSLFEERFGFHPEWRLEDQLAELVRRARASLK